MNNQKLDNELNLALSVGSEVRMDSAELSAGYDPENNKWELIVKHSGSLDRFASEDIRIEELIAGYAIVTLPESMLEVFSGLEEVEYIEKPKRIFEQVATSLEVSCFSAPLSGAASEEPLSGEGVYIAVIDSGIDYMLPVFRDSDGHTKIDYLWDQAKKPQAGERPPEGFAVGTEYDRFQIDDALERGDESLSRDVTGHGSDVAAIALQGAPGSRLIVVKLDVENQQSYPLTTSLMRAFTYVVKKAVRQGRPVAVNLSYGNTYGSHDGTSLLERFLDNVSEIGRNVICIGSGNEGASAGHFSERITERRKVELAVGNYESALSLQIWKNYADRYEITLISPSGESYRILQQAEDGSAQEVFLEQTRVLVYSGPPQPYRTKEEIYIDFGPDRSQTDYINSGIWQLQLEPVRIVNGNVQMYLPSEVIRSSATRFLLPNPEATLTIPSTAQRVITVGAYQAFFGAYADFSGRGYVMNAAEIGTGLAKPDLVAPGVNIRIDNGSSGVTVSGTSYATPFVTAAAALLMEWGIINGNDPFLYGEKVKAYLIRGARRLRGYEEWPNAMTGWGALCVADSIPGS